MKKRVLLTSTSFQDTPGAHHTLLDSCGWEVVTARGPLSEANITALVGDFDGIICGDDAFTRAVLEKARPRLQFLSKYGIGVDRIDIEAASELGLPVFFTPGVNHTTVAEHTLLLMLALSRQLVTLASATQLGEWRRLTGHEIAGKRLGIIGLGRIGREVAKRAHAFGMKITAMDHHWDEDFCQHYAIERAENIEALLPKVDVLSLHCNLSESTRNLLNANSLATMKSDALVINCARGEIIDTEAMVQALASGTIGGYGTDVLDEEPPRPDHPLLKQPRCLCTPHIGSRTHESVVRQASMAINNLKNAFEGKAPLAQVNQVPISR